MVQDRVVTTVAILMLTLIGCQCATNSTKCPESFKGLCSCGMSYSMYDNFKKSQYTINCTNAGFTNVDMLHDVPEKTEVLIFKGNSIRELPYNVLDNVLNYDYLKTIDMSNNHIQFIQGKSFHKVYSVETLILDHNDIQITDDRERPRMFSNFENLQYLHLTNAFSEKINASDSLLSLEDIFYESELLDLKVLHLEQNEIWKIGDNEKIFCELPKLEQLMLGDNRLLDFDFRIDCLENLMYIDLERNMISRLTDDAITRLEALEEEKTGRLQIKLEDNPFVCDCRSKKFMHWLNSTKIKIINKDQYMCVDGYPDENIGKTFKEVKELKCPSNNVQSHPRIINNTPSVHDGNVHSDGGEHHYHYGYSSATIGVLSFLLVFTTSLLLAVAYFNRQNMKALATPYWEFLTRKIGYTGLDCEETPQEVNV